MSEEMQILADRIINYAEQVRKGKIITCKKHRWACIRFLSDVKKIKRKKFEYYFDMEEVLRFVYWSRLFKHTKGVLAGESIELTDFQLFIVANIFGWKHKETGHRRFKKSYVQLARKNAKSQLLALIASYEAFLSGEQAEVYIAGVSREQSGIVYNEIATQLLAAPLLKGKYKESYGRITHLKTNSVIQPLSKEARKSGDGKNPSFVVIDEYHAHPTSEIYDVMLSGMAARPNGHICIITTAGLSVNGNPCFQEYRYVSNIIDPESVIENEEYFVLIAELDEEDDPNDQKCWIKANPIVATYKEGVNFLRGELKAAMDAPEKLRNYLTKNMNKWINSMIDGYMNLEKWNKCEEKVSLYDFHGQKAIIGVDLSAKIDLTSVGIIFKNDDGYTVFGHSFMPEDTLEDRIKSDRVPYDLWVKQGHITLTPGAVVDYDYIKKYIKALETIFGLNIQEICFDPWNASQFAQDMEKDGYVMVEVRQGIASLGEPTKNFREEVYLGNVVHDGNPVISWAIGNAVTRQDANENIMLDKSKAEQRIDPIAAILNAHSRAIVIEDVIDLNEHFKSEDFSF